VDEANLAGAVAVAIARRDLAGMAGRERLDRPARSDRIAQLGRGHDLGCAPPIGHADVHVLDEAHDLVAATEALCHRDHAVLVDATAHPPC
jgi:hypothetical protein